MPRCYIAGPMRGYPNANFDAFDEAKKRVAKLGYTPISPADLDRVSEGWELYPPDGFQPSRYDQARFMRRDLNIIFELQASRSDAIYLLPGWSHSRGAQVELALAHYLGLTVIYSSQAELD